MIYLVCGRYLVTEDGIRCCPALDDAVTVCSMSSHKNTQLSESQLTALVAIIFDEHGAGLNRDQFNDEAMNLLENIAGLEMTANKVRSAYLKTMWSVYQEIQPIGPLN